MVNRIIPSGNGHVNGHAKVYKTALGKALAPRLSQGRFRVPEPLEEDEPDEPVDPRLAERLPRLQWILGLMRPIPDEWRSDKGKRRQTHQRALDETLSKKKDAKPAPKERRTIFTAAELMAMELPEPRMIVSPILPEGLTVLAGRPKLGKSWLVLWLCLSIARGNPALGIYPTTPGDVLYLALEDSERRLKSRLSKLLGKGKVSDRVTIGVEWPRSDDGGCESLERWMDGVADPRLIVIDTLAKIRSIGKGSGNQYRDDYADVGKLQQLCIERGVGILANHHDRKAESGDFIDDVSGTLGIAGAADSIWVMRRDRGEADASLHVTGRDIEETEIALSFDKESGRWTSLGDAKAARMSEARQAIVDCLKDADEPKTPTEVAKLLGKNMNAVKKLMTTMHKDGGLRNKAGKYSLH